MRSRSRSFLVALVAIALVAASGCKKNANGSGDSGFPPQDDAGSWDGGNGPAPGTFLAPCLLDSDCESGHCAMNRLLDDGGLGGRCTKECTTNADCPSAHPWNCGDLSNGVRTCTCTPTALKETCDDTDDDCDGIADDGAQCPGLETCQTGACTCPPANACQAAGGGQDCVDLQTSELHCGTCQNACADSETCAKGKCVCPGEVCHGACIDQRYDNLNCSDCDKPCAAGEECVDSHCQPVDPEWTAWAPTGQMSFSSQGSSVLDNNTGLVWAGSLSDNVETFDQAVTTCALSSADGHHDWRLPTRAELLSLVDYTRFHPAIDTDAFRDGCSIDPTTGATTNCFAGLEWTSTPLATTHTQLLADGGEGDGGAPGGDGEADAGAPDAGSPAVTDNRWAVDFTDGSTRAYPVADRFMVRCVRR